MQLTFPIEYYILSLEPNKSDNLNSHYLQELCTKDTYCIHVLDIVYYMDCMDASLFNLLGPMVESDMAW